LTKRSAAAFDVEKRLAWLRELIETLIANGYDDHEIYDLVLATLKDAVPEWANRGDNLKALIKHLRQ
jgi:hypothetical protein